MQFERLIEGSARYYGDRFAEHGASARGVDWKDEASQRLRFARLLDVVDRHDAHFTLLDYGCGYGALVPYLRERGLDVDYQGFDVSPTLLAHARHAFEDASHTFVGAEQELVPSDYAVASGVFNVRLDHDDEEWTAYVVDQLRRLARFARRGFAFNMLTAYSEPEKMRPDLYYADPCFYFDVCKREFSRHVALAHDYGLWEFTIHVRTGPRA